MDNNKIEDFFKDIIDKISALDKASVVQNRVIDQQDTIIKSVQELTQDLRLLATDFKNFKQNVDGLVRQVHAMDIEIRSINKFITKVEELEKWKNRMEDTATIGDFKAMKERYQEVKSLQEALDDIKTEIKMEIRTDLKTLGEKIGSSEDKERIKALETSYGILTKEVESIKVKAFATGGVGGSVLGGSAVVAAKLLGWIQ